jgi:hypothetical protein
MAEEYYKQTYLDFGEDFKEELDQTYSQKITRPQYIPKMEQAPDVYMLIDKTKTAALIQEVESSNVSDKEKKFLKYAAMRHLTFNYSLIAEYYCHATPEMQRLMEKSALVILDMNDAIALGYVQLSENIKKIMEESGEPANERD